MSVKNPVLPDLIINGRKKDLGGFSVSRTLPSTKRRQVGPFVFLDHMGPLKIDETHKLDVRPHPHIGLATVTYLFEGRGFHRDSLGSSQVIQPGDLNWMTAGRGISHSERTPIEDQDPRKGISIHGIQIWVGLPSEHEDCEPEFTHYPSAVLPSVPFVDGIDAKLLIGKIGSSTSPVKILSPTLFMDLHCRSTVDTSVSFQVDEVGIFLITGDCQVNGQALQTDDLIVVGNPQQIQIKASANCRLIVIGGSPFPEPRFMWWNFVSSDKEKIRKAAEAWKRQEFGSIQGEVDFIPLPADPLP